jgi:diguanylate cyclase (GGDEF)-like protein
MAKNKPLNILIVDDSEDDAQLIIRALTGWRVPTRFERVYSLPAVLQALDVKSWDALIVDYRLPGFTGLDVIEAVRSRGRDIPMILASGTIGEETAVAAIKAGASDYVMKDRLGRLAPALDRAFDEAKLRAVHRRTQIELEESRMRLLRLTRVYAVLSGINGLIVRVSERDELFRGACRIAVEAGLLLMTWIGVVDDSPRIRPIAWYATDETHINAVPLGLDPSDPEDYGFAGKAVNQATAQVVHDVGLHPRILRRRGQRDFRSLVVLPLFAAHKVVGVMALYAAEEHFFDENEMKLLRELAGDISFALEHIEQRQQLDYLAYYDGLTGLANRMLFRERLEQAISASGAEGRKLALVVHDIERFKAINDVFGRQCGDELLRQVAGRFTATGTDGAPLARVGADQFAAFMPQLSSEEELAAWAQERARDAFAQPFLLDSTHLTVSSRLGIAICPDDGRDADTLFANAEVALKKAKATGERWLFYEERMNERIGEKLALESALRLALEKEELVLHYQPKISLDTGLIVGAEALLRWQRPGHGLVAPLAFVGLLEETGLILDAGSWALRRAAMDHRRWVESKLEAPRVAVNVSAIQLRQRDFVKVMERALARGISPSQIDLEITESVVMGDIQANIEKLEAVRELGVSIAIDDFGTGYSSLSYLARLPASVLKIDRAFVSELDDPKSTTLVTTIISLAHSLQMEVVAEGVETKEQAARLKALGCDQAQGYFFSRPLPFDELAPLLRNAAG